MGSTQKSIAGLVVLDHGAGFFLDWQTTPVLFGLRMPQGEMGARWELPGGKVEEGEGPRQAIRREFSEELGLVPRIGEALVSTKFNHHKTEFSVELYVLAVSAAPRQHPEHQELSWMSVQQALGTKLVDSDRSLLETLLSEFPQGLALGSDLAVRAK